MAVRKTRESYNAYMREYNKKNPDARRKVDYKRKFGITLDEYNQMFKNQDGLCAICGRPETRKDYRTGMILNLAVDHCHTTGQVRGLLCTDCNTAIGLLNDDPKVLLNAISYLTGV